ncbi:helix-turn-helix domain-containing protein [Lactobacillaceae bacterium Scapto_B20]
MLSIFGQRLRALRHGRNLTQSQLATALNERFDSKPHPNSEAQLGKWELGLRSPSIPELAKLAQFFDVSTDFLIGNRNDNVQDIAIPLTNSNELQFEGQPLSKEDREQVFELVRAYMIGKQARPTTKRAADQQEELNLDFGSDDLN